MSPQSTTAATIHHAPIAFALALTDRGFRPVNASEGVTVRRYVLDATDGKPAMTVAISDEDDCHGIFVQAMAPGTYGIAWDSRLPGNTPAVVALALVDAGLAARG